MKAITRTAVLLALVANMLAADGEREAWVESLYAKVRSGTSFPAETLATLESGTRVTVTGVEGNWSAVRLADGRTGFVSSRHLSDKKPTQAGLAEKLGAVSRAKNDGSAGTAGGRGVGPVTTDFAKRRNVAGALKDVEQLENQPYDSEALDAFMQEGGLGDFQG